MNLSANKVIKELKLENDELKHLLVKLMSKYKTSEIKRNNLLKRNAMLITDNKNLHLQLLETTKNKIVSEKAVKTYQEAVKLLKNELKELKSETSSRVDKIDTTPITKPVGCNIVSEKTVQLKEPSEQYFEVSEVSVRGGHSFSLKSNVSPPQSFSGTYASEDIATDAEAHSPSSDSQKDGYLMCSEVEAYYQMPDKTFSIRQEEFSNEVTNNKTESLVSDDTTNDGKDPFSHKRDRLWAQIKELREMTKVTDEELQSRRFAVAAKAEMIQNVHEEIKRMQTLITLTK